MFKLQTIYSSIVGYTQYQISNWMSYYQPTGITPTTTLQYFLSRKHLRRKTSDIYEKLLG